MLIPNHPHDERLAAYADADIDARADASLVAHLSTCPRCSGVVDELGALRSALADLPDIAPSGPLRLLPPVPDVPAAAGGGGWMRRLFAPAMTAGAALAIVGLVGTVQPFGQAQSGAALGEDATLQLSSEVGEPAGEEYAVGASERAALDGGAIASDDQAGAPEAAGASPLAAGAGDEPDTSRLAAEAQRPIWPMLLFAGIAILIGASLLRWILVPRAG